MSKTDINYENLANAVVEQVARDYRRAICRYHNAKTEEGRKRYKDEMDILERWFTGDDIKVYTRLDGTALMNGIKQQCAENNYDLTKIRRSLAVFRKKLESREEVEP